MQFTAANCAPDRHKFQLNMLELPKSIDRTYCPAITSRSR